MIPPLYGLIFTGPAEQCDTGEESVSQLWLFQLASSTSSHIQHAADVLDYGSASSFLLHLANII